MQNIDRKQLIEGLKGRARLLFPVLATALLDFAEKAEAAMTDPEKAKESRKKMQELQRAALDDRQKMAELNAIRVIQVQNFIYAMSNAGTFFEVVELAKDEEPVIENTTPQQMKARFIGEDGKPHMIQAIRVGQRKPVELGWISTRQLEYPLFDVYRGELAEQILASLDLARAIARGIDIKLWVLIKAMVGAFNTTATKPGDRTFVLEDGVNPLNIPTTNLVTLPSNTGTSRFRLDVIIAALKYCAQWGNAFKEGELAPVTFFVPSIDASGFLEDLTVMGNFQSTAGNKLAEQILNSGFITNVAGKNFNIVGDTSLNPDDGLCYVRLNRPIGLWFRKPSLVQTIPSSPDQIPVEWRSENKGKIMMKEPFGAATPLPYSVNMMAIRYRNAGSAWRS